MSEKQVDDILERIAAAGRKVLPMHEYLARADREGLDAYDRFLSASIYRRGALAEKYKEMLMACCCVMGGSSQPVIANHCRRAMAAGLERDELLQALEITAAVCATRAMASGILSLMEAEQQ